MEAIGGHLQTIGAEAAKLVPDLLTPVGASVRMATVVHCKEETTCLYITPTTWHVKKQVWQDAPLILAILVDNINQ